MQNMDLGFESFLETEVPEGELIVSRTDLKGMITYANDTFALISGYAPDELIGKPHNIVRHPDMPRSIFKELWETISAQKIWRGYVKNRRRDGGYYWVEAEVSGVYKDGVLTEYKSIRTPMEREKKIQMQKQYDAMCLEENRAVRMVTYLEKESIEKIRRLSAEAGIGENAMLNRMIQTFV